jgi:hypothetical protein
MVVKKKFAGITCLLLAASILPLGGVIRGEAEEMKRDPPRLKRADSFLGVHFDFHASDDCTEVGQNVTREMVESIIDQVKPDYIQCDCKGHRGISSYPTEVGYPAPGFVRDQLKIWREVTAERGVALYMHFSGVWDDEAVKHHPDWARIDEEGKVDDRKTSVYGPYSDEMLIPQMKELSDKYGVDGVWVDGECWATERDYHPDVIKAFQDKTGIETVPRTEEDPHWFEFSEFCRDGFRDYLDHYVTEMHKHNPAFQVASNWAYSSMMPEPVLVDVDFITGDYSAQNSVNSARLEGRSMVHQGKAWDLMAWSFTWTNRHFSTKTVPQFQREAAVVLALGGGFQGYFPQRRDGSIREWQMPLMQEVAKFCRDRQAVCHRAKPIPQVGLIYAGRSFYRANGKLFASWSGELTVLNGVLQSLLDAQQVVDIVMEHHLEDRMQDYPLLIWPEWETIEPEFKADLLAYVKKGGHLLIIGPRAAALFASELDITLLEQPEERLNGLEYQGFLAGLETISQEVQLGDKARPFGRLYNDTINVNDMVGPYETAASITSYGKGKIAATYLNLGERYREASHSVARDFLDGLCLELFPEPIVELTGSHLIDVTANQKDGNLMVNLVNTAGPHDDEKVYVYDEIPPVGPLTISIRADRDPQKITLEPGSRSIDHDYSDGKISLEIPRLAIHDIIVVQNWIGPTR